MAKKNSRSNANDGAVSSPAQPKAGRRVTRRTPPGNPEALVRKETEALVATQHAAHETSNEMGQAPDDGAQDLPAHRPQDFDVPGNEQSAPTPPEPSEHEIRLRAYLRYLERGAGHGADFDDWLQAEMELKKR
jgi:DUF2934 family protein